MGLGFMAVSWAAIILMTLLTAATVVQATTLIACATLLALPIAARIGHHRFDLFEPIVPATIALAVMFIGRPLADLTTGSFVHLDHDFAAAFDTTLIVVTIGIACFELGYASNLSRSVTGFFPRAPRRFDMTKSVIFACVLIVLALTLFGIFIATRGGVALLMALAEGRRSTDSSLFQSSTGYLYQSIDALTPATLIFVAAGVLTSKRKFYLGALLTGAPLFLFYAGHGSRSFALTLLLSGPVFWYVWRNRRPRFRSLLVVSVIAVCLIGFVRQVRNVEVPHDRSEQLAASFSDPGGQAADILSGADAEMFDSLANEITVVPSQLAYSPGGCITDIAIRAIPRVLWVDKPLELSDSVVTTLWPEHYQLSRASAAFSIMGSFYADSGVIGVAIGMFFVGVILAALWRWWQRNSGSVAATLTYSMMLPFVIVLMRGTIPDTLARLLFTAVPLFGLQMLQRIRLRPR
ncbi:MAG: O-antigen polymerase [Terriglobales bacterium]